MDRYPAFQNAQGQVGRGRGRGSVFPPNRRLVINNPNPGGFGHGRGDGNRYLLAQQQDRRARPPPVEIHRTPPGGPDNHNLNTPEIFNYQAHLRVQNQADAEYLSPPDRLEDPRDRNFSATTRPLNPDFADSPESYLGSPAEQNTSSSGGRDRHEQYNQSPLGSEFNDVDQTPRPQHRRGLTRDERSDQFDLIIPFPDVVPAEYRATPTPEEQHRQAANRARNRSAQAQVYKTHADRLRSISDESEDSDWETTAYDDSPRGTDFDHRCQPYHLNTVEEESEESYHYRGYNHDLAQIESFAYPEPQQGASTHNDGKYTCHQEGAGPYKDGQYASRQDRGYTQVAKQSAEDADNQSKTDKKNAGFGFLLQVVKKLDPRRAKPPQVELAATQSETGVAFPVAVSAHQTHTRRPTQQSQHRSPQAGSFDFDFPHPNYAENSQISQESAGSGSLFPPPAAGALEGVLERHEAYLASQAKKRTESSGHQPRLSFVKTHTVRNRSLTNAVPVPPPQGAYKPNFIRKATADLTTGFRSLFSRGTEDKSAKHEKKPSKEDKQATKKPERPEISAPVINATGTVPEGFNNPSLADLPQARVDQQRPEHYHRYKALQDPRWRVALAPKPSVAKRDNHHGALVAQSPRVQQGIQQQRAPHIRRLEAQTLPFSPIPETPSRPRRFSFESSSEYGDNAPPSTRVRLRGLTLRHPSPAPEAQTTKKERPRSRSCGDLLEQFQAHQAHEYQQILPLQSHFFDAGAGLQTVPIRQQARSPTTTQRQQHFSAPLDQHHFGERQNSPIEYRGPQQVHSQLDGLRVNRTRAAPRAIPPPSPSGNTSSFGGAPVQSHYFGEPHSFDSREDSSELLNSGGARPHFEFDEATPHNEGLSVITRSASAFAQSSATHQQESRTQSTSRQDQGSDDEYDFDERPEDPFLAQFLAPQLPILHVSTDEAADEIEKTKDKTLQGLGYLIRTVKEPTRQEAEERAGPNATEEQIDLAKGHIRADRLNKQIDQLVASNSDFGSREQAHKETTRALKRASLLPGILGRPGGLTRGQSPFLANRYTPSVRIHNRAQDNRTSPERQEQVEQRPNLQAQQINSVGSPIPDWLEAQHQARRRNERAQQQGESQTPVSRPQGSYAETLRQQSTDRTLGVSTPSRQPELELSSPESHLPLRQLQESQTPPTPRSTPPRQQEAIFSSPPSRVPPPRTNTEQVSSIRGLPALLQEINNRDRIGASDSAANIKQAALKLRPVKKSQPAPATQSTTPAGFPRGYQKQQQRGPRIPALPNNIIPPPEETKQPRLRTVSSPDILPQSFTTTPRGPTPGSRNASGIQTPGTRGEPTSPRAQGDLPGPSDTSSGDRWRLAPRVQTRRSRRPSGSSDYSFSGSNSRNLRDISNVSNTNVSALARRYENAAEGNPDGSDGQKRGSRGPKSRNVSGDA